MHHLRGNAIPAGHPLSDFCRWAIPKISYRSFQISTCRLAQNRQNMDFFSINLPIRGQAPYAIFTKFGMGRECQVLPWRQISLLWL